MNTFRKSMKNNDPRRFARMQKVEIRGHLTREATNVFSVN
ncbi:hypothetical protein THF1C08_50197 [Vibrio jasicida]|jgi:hypothetical protein|uniref:Transposase n=1 Tax=Vibrio jasicida TaxID=766224 RepID=A0AAU9QUJ1_9VIBR|nr:hypothetical protein THF1C08_50197 [Vibrio jasicida]CAH1601651.1 hypothetical protein THF1A12_50149 [Vibrio jasicida]